MGEITDQHVQYGDLVDPELDKIVADALENFPTAGMAVLVVEGDLVKAKGYGFADIENQIPVTPETMFFTGSTTKSFTSAMAAHLVESSDFPSISWNTPLAELIRDDFVLDQSSPAGQWATTHVTIEDALSHRTGLPRHDLAWVNGFSGSRELVRSLRHLPMQREMRTKFEYSNNPFTAVSWAVEKILDRPFKSLLKEHIFQPLKMQATTYDLEDALDLARDAEHLEMARGYLWNSQSNDFDLVPWEDVPPSIGAGGIISNVLDYSRWVRHLMAPTNLNAALSEGAIKAMRTPRTLVPSDEKLPYVGPEAYCLGLFSQTYRGREIVQHSGAIAGYMANMIMIPPSSAEIKQGRKSGRAVVTLQNSYSLAQNVVGWYLLDQLLETPEQDRFDMAQVARKQQSEKEKSMEWDAVVERLYGKAAKQSHITPRLPLSAYEGVYRHPAYHEFEISMSPLRGSSSDSMPASESRNSDGTIAEAGVPLYMAAPASREVYLGLTATLHHVSGETWWVHQRSGPSSWITDSAKKLRFVVGVDGNVDGMKFQAESEMADELAFFQMVD